jgi:hypothetical protein
MDRLLSLMSASMSMLQLVTAMGCVIATLLRVRSAANRRTGLLLDRNNCSTVIAGASSRALTSRRLQIARAASNITLERRERGARRGRGQGEGEREGEREGGQAKGNTPLSP